ncbi:hypothetical protein [Pseudalkalibacillus salsuginis]|nr:hypothetical protein [Pseudalkalibacillus salsuginis]
MNFEIFMGLIGVPGGIILIAVVCYVVLGKRDREVEVERKEGISK